jgi:hypothetical protein
MLIAVIDARVPVTSAVQPSRKRSCMFRPPLDRPSPRARFFCPLRSMWVFLAPANRTALQTVSSANAPGAAAPVDSGVAIANAGLQVAAQWSRVAEGLRLLIAPAEALGVAQTGGILAVETDGQRLVVGSLDDPCRSRGAGVR